MREITGITSGRRTRDALQGLLDLFEISPVNRPVLEEALRSGIPDCEDAVLEQAGRLVAVDAITTRNGQDFKKATVPVFEPAELLSVVETMESANKASDSDEE